MKRRQSCRPRMNLKAVTLIVLTLLSCSSCELYYLHYTDCGYYDEPRFNRAILNQPVLNQTYADQVRLLLDDDSHIDSYDYSFEFAGGLPAGITYYQNGRSIYFEGTATSQGTYSLLITASVRYRIYDRYYYNYSRDYCTYRTAQNFQLTVKPI